MIEGGVELGRGKVPSGNLPQMHIAGTGSRVLLVQCTLYIPVPGTTSVHTTVHDYNTVPGTRTRSYTSKNSIL